MAISPASDIILDVARAADPQKALATTRVLADGSGTAEPSTGFSQALQSVSATTSGLYSYRNPVASSLPASGTAAQKATVGLESVLLKTFIDQMLPKDAVEVFGGGVAGDVWKSMLSEKIADEVAKSGALRIGKRLFATHPDRLQSLGNKTTGSFPPAPPAAAKI
jgi:peptidoglycan hydrolase FlgJ